MIELHLDRGATALPLYTQIEQQIIRQIIQGQLKNGDLLPPTRDMARQLTVSRGSVVRADELLCSKGYCQSQTGRGTIVFFRAKTDLSYQNHAQTAISQDNEMEEIFSSGSLSLLPSHASTAYLPVSEFRQAFNRVLRYSDRLNRFGESSGNQALRQIICEKLLPSRGISALPSEVLIVPGSQYGSLLLAMAKRQERSCFHFGTPGYMEFARNFAHFGYHLQPHRMDSEGIDISDLCGSSQDILYLMPEHHFPQCITLSDAKRSDIIQLTSQKNVLVLEDDYDSEFYFNRAPRPALRSSAARHNIVYMGTFSKVLFNTLRLGYMVADEPLIKQMTSLHWNLSRGTSGLLQQWVSELIKSGTYERHIRRMRTVYRHKRDYAVKLVKQYLPDACLSIPSGGLQLTISFPELSKVKRVLDWLRRNNIQVADPQNYLFKSVAQPSFIILGFANCDFHELEAVLARISRIC